MYEAKVLQHSVTSKGIELVTFEVNYPHAVHKDIMTHRWARNFQSFRAVPTEILLEKIRKGEYFIPEKLSTRVKGMGRGASLAQDELDEANRIWAIHVAESAAKAERWSKLKIAKEQTNFLLQDLCFIRGIITTTLPQLNNFFGLRLGKNEQGDPLARLEVYKIASMMNEAYVNSNPWVLNEGEWHLPLVSDLEIMGPDCGIELEIHEIDWDLWRKVSVGRCARVSYLTHLGIRDPEADVALHDRLLYDGHMSPFEHQGTPLRFPELDYQCGSFGIGWTQYRKLIRGESDYATLRAGV